MRADAASCNFFFVKPSFCLINTVLRMLRMGKQAVSALEASLSAAEFERAQAGAGINRLLEASWQHNQERMSLEVSLLA